MNKPIFENLCLLKKASSTVFFGIPQEDYTNNAPRMILGEQVTRNNAYIESFNGKYRDELLDREIFTALTEASILTEQWRKE